MLGISLPDCKETKKVVSSTNPRKRKWIDLPLGEECLLQVELKRRSFGGGKVSQCTVPASVTGYDQLLSHKYCDISLQRDLRLYKHTVLEYWLMH